MKVKQSIQQLTPMMRSDSFPIEKQPLMSQQKLQSQNHKYQPAAQLIFKCLPPRYHFQCIYGEMILNFTNLLFSDGISKKRNLIYQCHMLGYSNKQCPFIKDEIIYTIHTSNKMFKQYLKDMNTCLIGIYDSRNYEPIGHFYLNFLMYMKSIQDNVVQAKVSTNSSRVQEANEYQNSQRYYLPFIDQKCQIILPVYDYKNKKQIQNNVTNQKNSKQTFCLVKNTKQRIIGQITLKFSARIYQNPISLGYLQIKEQPQNKQNTRNSKISNLGQYQLNISKVKQYQRKSLLSPNNYLTNHAKNFTSKNMIPSSKLISKQQNSELANVNSRAQISSLIGQSQGNQTQNKYQGSLFKGTPKHSFVNYNRESINDKHKMLSSHQNKDRKSNFKQNNIFEFPVSNQLELMQLKLQAQQLFSLQKKDNQSQLNNSSKYISKAIIEIIKVKSKITVPYLDVYISQNSQDREVTHLKIYKHQGSHQKIKNQQLFLNKIMIQGKNQKRIEIILPNSQGKCQFSSNDISQNGSQVCIFNKGAIIGFLILKKQSILNGKNNSENNKQLRKQKQKSQIPTKVALIYISNFQQQFFKESKQNNQYFLCIKNTQICKISKQSSLENYKIVDNSQIPNTFSIQVKNKKGQILGISQNIISKPKQIILSESNIMPHLILDKTHSIKMSSKRQNAQKMSFKLMYYVGTINQISYLVQKLQTQIQNHQKVKSQMLHNTNQNKLKHKAKQDRQKEDTIKSHHPGYPVQNQNKHKQSRQQKIQSIELHKNQNHQLSQNQKPFQKNRFHTQQQLYQQEDGKEKMIDQLQDQFHQQVEQAQISHTYLVQFFINSFCKIMKKCATQQTVQAKLLQLKQQQLVNQLKFVKVVQNLMPYQKTEDIEDQLQLMKAIFIDAVATQQLNSNTYNLKQFIGCLSSFYNFFNLFTTIKQQIIKQFLQKQPMAIKKLQSYYQLKIVTQSQLFNKILTKTPLFIQQKMNKLYRFGVSDPISIKFLVDELNHFNNRGDDKNKLIYNFGDLKNNKSSIQSQGQGDQAQKLRIHSLASDLGRLIRETIEEVLISKLKQKNLQEILKNLEQLIDITEDAEQQKKSIQNINYREINIKQFKQFMEKQDIQITIWESLIIIEQVKGWFSTDFGLDEGIISFNSISDWLKSLNRKVFFKTKQQKSERIQIQSIRSINTQRNQVMQERNKIYKNIQKDFEKEEGTKKLEPSKNGHLYSENTSNLNINNQSDIANIANLLREQHNNLYAPSMSELPRQNKQWNQIKQSQNILKNLTNNQNQSEQMSIEGSIQSEQQQYDSQLHNQANEQTLQLCLNIKLKSFKLKQNIQYQLQNKKNIKKLTFKYIQKEPMFQSQKNQQYFYLRQMDVQNFNLQDFMRKYQINQIIDAKKLKIFQTNIKTLSLSLCSIRNSQRTNEIRQDLQLTGSLPVQQITSFIQDNKAQFQVQKTQQKKFFKSKTIVLYNAKKDIIGKALIQMSLINKIKAEKIQNLTSDSYQSFLFSFQIKNGTVLKNKIKSISNFNNFNAQTSQSKFSLSYFHQKSPLQIVNINSQIEENIKYQIRLPEPLLEYRILIKFRNQIFDMKTQNDQDYKFQCTVSLQQLFFRKIINRNQYPVIDTNTGQFICSLLVLVSPKIEENYQQKKIDKKYFNQQNRQNNFVSNNENILNQQQNNITKNQMQQSYLFIPISLFSIFIRTEQNMKHGTPKKLTGNLYLKKLSSLNHVQILFKSEQLQIRFDKQYIGQKIQGSLLQIEDFCVIQIPIQKNNKYFVQFIYEGRKISESGKLSFQNLMNKKKESISLNMCQQNLMGIQMRLTYNLVKYQKNTFRMNNVFKALKSILNKKNQNKVLKIDEKILKNQKNQKKLTFTQYKMLQKIIKDNKVSQIQQRITFNQRKFSSEIQKLNYFKQLMREFAYKEQNCNKGQIIVGRLTKNELKQIFNDFQIQFNQECITQDYILLLEQIFISLRLFKIDSQQVENNKIEQNQFSKPAYNSVNELYKSLKEKYH